MLRFVAVPNLALTHKKRITMYRRKQTKSLRVLKATCQQSWSSSLIKIESHHIPLAEILVQVGIEKLRSNGLTKLQLAIIPLSKSTNIMLEVFSKALRKCLKMKIAKKR
jgi:hypothetical protein